MKASRILPLVVLGALAGCSESSLQQVPNRAPVAVAYVWEGETIESTRRLGYVIVDDVARLDGSQSFDEDARDRGQLTYDWSFESVPPGSALTELEVPEDDDATVDLDEDAYPTFEPDVVGTYRVRLVVDDGKEASRPAIVNVQALPPSQLTVQLQWDVSGVDLDLHLLKPGGGYFEPDGDCFSWFPEPDWGSDQAAEDNPKLDRDRDGEGLGPFRETITLPLPEPGAYRIGVHYFADHSSAMGGGSLASGDVEVQVRVLGNLVGPPIQAPEPLLEGDVWWVRELTWPERSLSAWTPEMSTHEDEGGPDYN